MPPAENAGVTASTIVKRGVVALLLSLLVNFAIVQAVLSLELTGTTENIDFISTAIVTTIGVTGATVVYALLARRAEHPNRLFVRVAVVALLLSFLPNIGLILSDGAASDEVVVLMIMHVPPAAACVASLTGRLFGIR